MPTFVHAVLAHNQITIDYGFVLKLSSLDELLDYWRKRRAGEFGEGWSNFLASKECEHFTKGTYSGKEHVSNAVGQVLSQICYIETKKERNEEVLVKDVLGSFVSKVFEGMSSQIKKHGAIYVQACGSYFPHSDGIVIHKTIERDDFDFPIFDKTIKVFQWQGGKHFYAKVGHLTVVDAGLNQKWNTYGEAERQAKVFAEKLPKTR